MKLSLVFLIAAIIYILFALGALLAPAWLGSLYGIPLVSGQLLPVRVAGAALGGYAALCWLIRNQTGAGLRGVLIGLLVWNALGALVFLLAVLVGDITAFGWVSVILYALLTVGFGYFTFMKPATAT